MSGPFHAFAQSIQPQTPLRAAITAAWRRPETECVPPLIEQAKLAAQELYTVGLCGEKFAEHLRRQHVEYGRIIREAGIKG